MCQPHLHAVRVGNVEVLPRRLTGLWLRAEDAYRCVALDSGGLVSASLLRRCGRSLKLRHAISKGGGN